MVAQLINQQIKYLGEKRLIAGGFCQSAHERGKSASFINFGGWRSSSVLSSPGYLDQRLICRSGGGGGDGGGGDGAS